MFSTQTFKTPQDGEVSLCEVDGVLHSGNPDFTNVTLFTTAVAKHPQIHLNRNSLHSAAIRDENRALFQPVEEPLLKKLSQIYYEQGFLDMLSAASDSEYLVISKLASITLKSVNYITKVLNNLNPCLKECNWQTINEFSATRNWSSSPIRCFAWHNLCPKLAVAGSDDVVRIYTKDSTFTPLLKCQQQKNITCLAWRPMCLTDIAVGCKDLIIIWTVDPASVVTRPSISNAIIVQRNEHRGIISLEWSPRGDVLASAALCDSKILIWDVEMNRTSALKRPGYSGNCLLKWSKSGDKLFCSTNGLVFRVWNCQTWHLDRWTIQSGRVTAACWSNCSSFLLFATNQEAIVYGLTFTPTDVFKSPNSASPNLAAPLYDINKADANGIHIGSIIRHMEMDPNGQKLALMFDDSDCVVVLDIKRAPVLGLSSCLIVNGLPEERPVTIGFQKDFEFGACLSVAWSSGRMQHFPMVSLLDVTPVVNESFHNSALSASVLF